MIKKFLSNYYKRSHPLFKNVDKRVNIDWVINRAMLSDNKFCYFRIPKCANSTIVKTLLYYYPSYHYDSNDSKGSLAKKAFRGSIYKVKKIDPITFSDNLFCFTFVRNPYSRLLSAYLDKLVSQVGKPKYAKIRSKILKTQKKTELSFNDFVSFLETDGLFSDPHWCPQYSLIPIPLDLLAYIGKVEQLHDDLGELIPKIFNIEYKGLVLREEGRQRAKEKSSHFYNEELIERVFNLYRKDFEYFGYNIGDI